MHSSLRHVMIFLLLQTGVDHWPPSRRLHRRVFRPVAGLQACQSGVRELWPSDPGQQQGECAQEVDHIRFKPMAVKSYAKPEISFEAFLSFTSHHIFRSFIFHRTVCFSCDSTPKSAVEICHILSILWLSVALLCARPETPAYSLTVAITSELQRRSTCFPRLATSRAPSPLISPHLHSRRNLVPAEEILVCTNTCLLTEHRSFRCLNKNHPND